VVNTYENLIVKEGYTTTKNLKEDEICPFLCRRRCARLSLREYHQTLQKIKLFNSLSSEHTSTFQRFCTKTLGTLLLLLNCRGIKSTSICPFVGIFGSPHPPPPRKRVYPPWTQRERGTNTGLRVRGCGEPIRTTGQKVWHSVYSVLVTMTRTTQ
jgi:hypothetical protein